jgi:hypothetical protein
LLIGNQLEFLKTLLERTGNVRECIVCVAPDQLYGAYDNDQNYRQHDGVLGNVLTGIVVNQATK